MKPVVMATGLMLIFGLMSPALSATVNLSWKDNCTHEQGSRVERATSSSPWTQIAQVGTNVTPYADNTAVAGTTYYYRVKTYDSSWTSQYSNIATKVVAAAGATNVALNKTATADSTAAGGYDAGKAVDGSGTTRWCASDGNPNHWWKVDLGRNYALTGTKITWEFSGAYKYKIEGSTDGSSWSTLVNQTGNTVNNSVNSNSFNGSARYLRLTVTGLPSGAWASFYEFEAYGT